jgi:hypothetical protein
MTIKELIDKVQEEKPNTFSDEKLLSFVNEIESDVCDQLFEDFYEYTSVDATELRVPEPYSRLYESYVKARIDYTNEELESYQNNQAQHVQDFKDFVDWVVRTAQAIENPMPKRFRNVF